MFDRLARLLNRSWPLFKWAFLTLLLVLLVGVTIICFELFVWPWIMTNETLKRLGLAPASGERVTIVERRETVTVSQDENFERLVAEYGAIVVGLTALSPDETLALPERARQRERSSATWLTNDGLIVTYSEMVPAASLRWLVSAPDRSSETAVLVGHDALTNLAFFRVDRDSTPAVAFTNTRDLRTGRRVTLLGVTGEARPALVPTVIESIDRTFNLAPQTVASADKWEGVLDVPDTVLAGYVGGPAILGNGEMAGIVGSRQIDGRTDTFLVPADVVRQSLDRIIAERGPRPVVGLSYLSLTPERAAVFGLERDRGALVYSPSGRTGLSVIAGSPAARAGLQYGDIITAVDGAEINLDLPLSVALGRFSIGDTVRLTILRGVSERELSLSL